MKQYKPMSKKQMLQLQSIIDTMGDTTEHLQCGCHEVCDGHRVANTQKLSVELGLSVYVPLWATAILLGLILLTLAN